MLSLGICAYGAARILERRGWGWVCLARRRSGSATWSGPTSPSSCSPRSPSPWSSAGVRSQPPVLGPVGRIVTIVVLMAAMAFVLGAGRRPPPAADSRATSTTEAVGELLDRAESGTDEGGSQIDRPTPNTPLEYPVRRVLGAVPPDDLRGGHGRQRRRRGRDDVPRAGARASCRGSACATCRRWRSAVPTCCSASSTPAIFAFAWSSFANLGALARQRVQVWPFVLLLLALPLVQARRPEPVERPGTFTRRPEVVAP